MIHFLILIFLGKHEQNQKKKISGDMSPKKMGSFKCQKGKFKLKD
jgi:hypothetical protein